MHVLVEGARLFFDVVGTVLDRRGPEMLEKSTLLLLHGGPGMDHWLFRLALPEGTARFERFEDCSHLSWMDQPEGVLSAICEFLLT